MAASTEPLGPRVGVVEARADREARAVGLVADRPSVHPSVLLGIDRQGGRGSFDPRELVPEPRGRQEPGRLGLVGRRGLVREEHGDALSVRLGPEGATTDGVPEPDDAGRQRALSLEPLAVEAALQLALAPEVHEERRHRTDGQRREEDEPHPAPGLVMGHSLVGVLASLRRGGVAGLDVHRDIIRPRAGATICALHLRNRLYTVTKGPTCIHAGTASFSGEAAEPGWR